MENQSNVSSCDILNLEWASSGRDRETAIPICYTLRQKGYSVIEANIFNYRYYILKHRPRVLFISGGYHGAEINYQAVKFAHKIGLPVITSIGEGDYRITDIKQIFWGHNIDKKY